MEAIAPAIVKIPTRNYWVGDDSRVETSPRHLVAIDEPFWIDSRPVTLGMIEHAIVAGALDAWCDAASSDDRSIDGLIRREIDRAEAHASSHRSARTSDLQDVPACLVPWDAAVLLCIHWNARLPSEAEWEIAMHGLAPLSRGTERSLGSLRKTFTAESDLGCLSCAGDCGEWTSSAWSERYFAGTAARTGPSDDGRVVVRGRLMSAFARAAAATRSDEPQPTVFRRVWDSAERLPGSVPVDS